MAGQSRISLKEYSEIVEYFQSGKIPVAYDLNFTKRQGFLRRLVDFRLESDGVLRKSVDNVSKIVICYDDEERIAGIVQSTHVTSSHKGRDEVFRRISENYTGISKIKVGELVSTCQSCQLFTPLTSNPRIIPIRAHYVWERLQMDIVNISEYQQLNDGYCYLLNVIDCFSKYVFSTPLRQQTALAVHNYLEELFLVEGYPYILHSDNGKEFKNTLVQDLCTTNNIKFIYGQPRHPQTQGTIERVNQTITRSIIKSCHESQTWYKQLPKIISNYNRSFHRAIQATPFEVFKGKKILNNNEQIILKINSNNFIDSYNQSDNENQTESLIPETQVDNNGATNDFEAAPTNTDTSLNAVQSIHGSSLVESVTPTDLVALFDHVDELETADVHSYAFDDTEYDSFDELIQSLTPSELDELNEHQNAFDISMSNIRCQ